MRRSRNKSFAAKHALTLAFLLELAVPWAMTLSWMMTAATLRGGKPSTDGISSAKTE